LIPTLFIRIANPPIATAEAVIVNASVSAILVIWRSRGKTTRITTTAAAATAITIAIETVGLAACGARAQ
jgi:hypothetical protein